jgi:uncharacterized protein
MQNNHHPRAFLTAEWRNLVMLNYAVDPAVVAPFVPAGTELDFFHGCTYVSIVGFQFLNTRLLGVPVPCHRNFEEINLRLYVRRRIGDELRRGVVFIKEIVARYMVSFVARRVYNESYITCKTRCCVNLPNRVCYEWRLGDRWMNVTAAVDGLPAPLFFGSEEEFITEHYWGYTRQRDGGTIEYAVEHPSWRVWRATSAHLDCDVANLYGLQFVPFLSAEPTSAFVAEGSPVIVRRGTRIA